MKFRVQYTRILPFEEDIEVNSLEEARWIASQRNKELTNTDFSDAVDKWVVTPRRGMTR